MEKNKFSGKVAIVTGGASGLGKAIVSGFAQEGAKVVVADINPKLGQDVTADLKASGCEAVFGQVDVGKYEDCQKLIRLAMDTYGRVDILVNCAGVSIYGSAEEISLEDWHKTLDVDLTGPFMLMKEAIPHMKDVGGGSVINIASLAGLRCIPKNVAYCSSKAGLINLTKQVALDYGQYNIRCNAICPGLFLTDMAAEGFEKTANDLGTDLETFITAAFSEMPLRKPAYPAKVYGICRFLASEDSAYITGAAIRIDGGIGIVDPFSVGVAKAVEVLSKKAEL